MLVTQGRTVPPPAADELQFIGLFVATVLIVGGLAFFPTLALGPVAKHFASSKRSLTSPRCDFYILGVSADEFAYLVGNRSISKLNYRR